MDFRNRDAVAAHASALIQVDELARLLAGPGPARPVVLDVRYRMGTMDSLQSVRAPVVPVRRQYPGVSRAARRSRRHYPPELHRQNGHPHGYGSEQGSWARNVSRMLSVYTPGGII
jgi:hypothetical protein